MLIILKNYFTPMEDQNINALIKNISVIMKSHFNSQKSSIEILNLSKNCVRIKKKTLLALKGVVSENFLEQLKTLELLLRRYEEEYSNLKERIPDETIRKYMFECYNILDTIFSDTDKLSKYLLPINLNSYFLDIKMPYIEKVVRRLIFRKLKEYRNNLGHLIIMSIISYEDVSSSGNHSEYLLNESLARSVKFMIKTLNSFNLRNKAFKYSEDIFMKKYLEDLKPSIHNFTHISNYFQNRTSICPSKLKKKIEKKTLNQLYCDFSLNFESNVLLENIKSLYYIFCTGDLKNKLLEAFQKLLNSDIKSISFSSFIHHCQIAKLIVESCPDDDFFSCLQKYFENLAESQNNCKEIAIFVDSTIKNEENIDNLKIIADIIDLSKNPELLLSELQQMLTFRLFNLFKKSKIDISDQISKESMFLSFFKKPYHSENMCSMIKDLENSNNNVLLMKMCKWPVFAISELEFPSDNPISLQKKLITESLKDDKKRVSWIDSLSFVKIRLFEKEAIVSLFQYHILNKLINEGIPLDSHPSAKSLQFLPFISSHSTVLHENLADCIPLLYIDQFNCLLGDIIIKQDDLFILNPLFKKNDFLDFKYRFISSSTYTDVDYSYNTDAYNQARVSKILKKLKNLTFESILENLPDMNIETLKLVITELENKGICELKGGNILFCP